MFSIENRGRQSITPHREISRAGEPVTDVCTAQDFLARHQSDFYAHYPVGAVMMSFESSLTGMYPEMTEYTPKERSRTDAYWFCSIIRYLLNVLIVVPENGSAENTTQHYRALLQLAFFTQKATDLLHEQVLSVRGEWKKLPKDIRTLLSALIVSANFISTYQAETDMTPAGSRFISTFSTKIEENASTKPQVVHFEATRSSTVQILNNLMSILDRSMTPKKIGKIAQHLDTYRLLLFQHGLYGLPKSTLVS